MKEDKDTPTRFRYLKPYATAPPLPETASHCCRSTVAAFDEEAETFTRQQLMELLESVNRDPFPYLRTQKARDGALSGLCGELKNACGLGDPNAERLRRHLLEFKRDILRVHDYQHSTKYEELSPAKRQWRSTGLFKFAAKAAPAVSQACRKLFGSASVQASPCRPLTPVKERTDMEVDDNGNIENRAESNICTDITATTTIAPFPFDRKKSSRQLNSRGRVCKAKKKYQSKKRRRCRSVLSGGIAEPLSLHGEAAIAATDAVKQQRKHRLDIRFTDILWSGISLFASFIPNQLFGNTMNDADDGDESKKYIPYIAISPPTP